LDESPLFLTEDQVLAIHDEQIELFGGAMGILSPEGLATAVHAPIQVYLYVPQATLFDLATSYAFSLGKNHAFRDGNKRVASACAIAFLDVNGVNLKCSFTDEMIALVTDQISKEEFSRALEKVSFRKHGLTAFIRKFFQPF